jgi:hypothetical protein
MARSFEVCPICGKKGRYIDYQSHIYLTSNCRYCHRYYVIADWSVMHKPYPSWVHRTPERITASIEKEKQIYARLRGRKTGKNGNENPL